MDGVDWAAMSERAEEVDVVLGSEDGALGVAAGRRGGRREEEAVEEEEGIEEEVDARGAGVMGSRGADECSLRAAWTAEG